MLTVSRGTRSVCIAIAAVTVAGLAAASVGAAQPVNGQIVFAATVGQESRLFSIRSGAPPTQLTTHAQLSASPSWSPDRRYVVVSSPGPYGSALFVVTLATGVERALTSLHSGVDDIEPAWSPDGRQIAFTALTRSGTPSAVMVVRADGSNEERLAAGHSPTWSPDSRQIAFANSDFIFRISAAGHVPRRLVHKFPANARPQSLAWSPDGRRIAYAVASHVWWTGVDGHAVHSVRNFAPATEPGPFGGVPVPARPVDRVAWSAAGRRVLVALGRADGSLGERLVSVGRDRPSVVQLGQLDGTADSAWSASRRRVAMTRSGVGRRRGGFERSRGDSGSRER